MSFQQKRLIFSKIVRQLSLAIVELSQIKQFLFYEIVETVAVLKNCIRKFYLFVCVFFPFVHLLEESKLKFIRFPDQLPEKVNHNPVPTLL